MPTLPAFYHPTKIVSVDDDHLFLTAVSQLFSPDFLVQTFNHPDDCLAFFDAYVPPLDSISMTRCCIEHEKYDTINHAIIDVDVQNLSQLQFFHDKNQEVSVILVDYSMQKMNGIELCRSLKKFPFKKILLTGNADFHVAVHAFNENIIDRFIRKDSETVAHDIVFHTEKLAQEYFRERTKPFISHLETDGHLPLSDPIFITFFEFWCKNHTIKEYFLIDKKGSFQVTNHQNESFYCIIHTDQSLNAFVEFYNTCTELYQDKRDIIPFITAIENREKIPFFGPGKESWECTPATWENYFYPATIIHGREKYYWTVVDCKRLSE